MILYLDDFLILGSTYQEAQSYTAMAVSLLESLGSTVNLEKPPTGESCKSEISLLEGKGDSNYVRSSISKCTRHSTVMSPSNLAGSPSFSILANQIDPSSTCKRPEF